ncbi:hypothetical protein AGABI2DRAFT_144088 [Agaricus bisporus var. bisporus H97]|uniref:hypothetical protein n=1 Tax=Agaricus bisporus var. bisporus (strain H97 / ATCC MYA-4626 / FGSC 10389) TaxID=936046 RepID=UPI00029F7922|nr:hypothetical protein AGABI2DRAFT_144088 [Agaricus bisporus var. bisporus H97]EKV45702.1 hypothetical protein AGABI2DRAFT_144088 [Agaricus bisporus var. bisporus H97]
MAQWIRTTIDTWTDHEYGNPLNGPVWSIASDGDGTFRRARHFICSKKELDLSTELGKLLADLPGLNLHTSAEGITATCDPKHIFKRFATALRNENGIVVGKTIISPQHTLQIIKDLPTVDARKAKDMLDPEDKQNVPKAVSLIQHLMSLRNIEPVSTSLKIPSFLHRRRMLEFFGQFLGYFMSPFTDVTMSLQEQLESISTFVHIFMVLWQEHGYTCLTGQLYADSQAVVKNIYFLVGRLQVLNPAHKFFFLHEGSDRLESLFGNVRTMDHSRNFDIRQLSEKVAVATLIHAAYAVRATVTVMSQVTPELKNYRGK